MNNVTCKLGQTTMGIYRGEEMVGMVYHRANEEDAVVSIFANENGIQYLTLNDLEIIQDNWNQMQEMNREKS